MNPIHHIHRVHPSLLVLSSAAAISLAGAAHGIDLKADGAFGFPQKSATVFCDTPDLRLSAASDGTHLFVQAIIWKDNDNAVGSTDDGRKIGDWSSLMIDCDADGKATPDVDRDYSLNPWPSAPGLHYCVIQSENSNSGLEGDSKGRGSTQYLEAAGQTAGEPVTNVRVDTFLIPLDELRRKEGDQVKLAFWASSPTPAITVNSVGFVPKDPAKKYWSHHLPRESRHTFTLAKSVAEPFDAQKVPEGRGTIQVKAKKEPPKVGAAVGEAGGPPEVSAAAWRNWKGDQPPTLASLKGKVVVVEFWATWCGPCVAGIPHLNDLHTKHAKDGLVILSLTDQERGPVEKFMDKKGEQMAYAVGIDSDTIDEYGVRGIPHAFVIGRNGKLAWEGHPAQKEFDAAVEAALNAN